MSELVRLVLDVAKFLWPLRPVEQWEIGVYYILGRAYWEVGPGRWPVIPYFMDVRAVSVVPALVSTPLQTITLRDGTSLTFGATATVRVERAADAINLVNDYNETTVELVASVLAERLAKVDANRLDPERRGRLMADLLQWLDAETGQFGVRVLALRFTNFALNVRTYRLLMDTSQLPEAAVTW